MKITSIYNDNCIGARQVEILVEYSRTGPGPVGTFRLICPKPDTVRCDKLKHMSQCSASQEKLY